MKTQAKAYWITALLLTCAISAQATQVAETPVANAGSYGLQPLILVGLAAMLIVAKLGGELFERLKQPAVLGELIGGIVVGNLVLLGFNAAEPLKTNEIIGAIAEIGVIILLF